MDSKPSLNPTRQSLIDYGLQQAVRGGFRALTVRGVCAAAGVNPGSFVYHFGNREAFISELIETWYAPLFTSLQWQFDRDADPLTRLTDMLRQLLGFVREQRTLISQMLLDAGAGEVAVQRFVASLAPRHPRLLLQCVMAAQQAGQLRKADPLHMLMFLLSSLGMPVLLRTMTEGKGLLPEMVEQGMSRFAAEPDALEERLGWALQGLKPEESP